MIKWAQFMFDTYTSNLGPCDRGRHPCNQFLIKAGAGSWLERPRKVPRAPPPAAATAHRRGSHSPKRQRLHQPRHPNVNSSPASVRAPVCAWPADAPTSFFPPNTSTRLGTNPVPLREPAAHSLDPRRGRDRLHRSTRLCAMACRRTDHVHSCQRLDQPWHKLRSRSSVAQLSMASLQIPKGEEMALHSAADHRHSPSSHSHDRAQR